ncbi:hepatitis A virus cellular receptor 1 homolog [Hyla sarda]|uniref:hepatitis A virus cellular receptor 1 homolog n=1 Tax=Hyla sarda TaxID=327740 RepID=UPI0024C471E9|nr:hepatitis A virus cellular receptor 1 homolog [Hyla sarda]
MLNPKMTVLCLLILTDLSVWAGAVTVVVGGTVVLPCTYPIADGTTSMCWGRGQCPNSKCNNGIIWTDSSAVTWRSSDRYQLMGNITEGDVTLTITGVTSDDAGIYCCRVEIPGLFNDQKIEIDVEINEGSFVLSPTTSPPLNESMTMNSAVSYAPVFYTVVVFFIALLILFGILMYRNQYLDKKISNLSNTMSALSLRTLESAVAVENVYVKMES